MAWSDPYFYATKDGKVWAFATSAERNFWVFHSNAKPLTKYDVRQMLTGPEIRQTWEAWPNSDEDREFLKGFYEEKLDELDEEFVRMRRMRMYLGKITGRNLKKAEISARERVDGGSVRLPRR